MRSRRTRARQCFETQGAHIQRIAGRALRHAWQSALCLGSLATSLVERRWARRGRVIVVARAARVIVGVTLLPVPCVVVGGSCGASADSHDTYGAVWRSVHVALHSVMRAHGVLGFSVTMASHHACGHVHCAGK